MINSPPAQRCDHNKPNCMACLAVTCTARLFRSMAGCWFNTRATSSGWQHPDYGNNGELSGEPNGGRNGERNGGPN
eukprot:1995808-Prymnesium_polylepis.1